MTSLSRRSFEEAEGIVGCLISVVPANRDGWASAARADSLPAGEAVIGRAAQADKAVEPLVRS